MNTDNTDQGKKLKLGCEKVWLSDNGDSAR
jgi:hypothetical protein